MKSIIKPMSFALSLLLALSLLGCSAAPKDTAAPIATEAPAAASAPTPEPEPTEDTARAEAETALKELDERMFAESVVSDALSFHLTVAHPENFPLITDYPTGWGEFTYAEQEASNEENIAWLEELYAIDRNALSDDSKITYDTLVQFLEQGIEGNQYYYYNEVLDTFVGLHSNLPLNLVFYDMHTKADVENYLTLLADTPRYVGQVLAFEQEKSADGKFMRDNALDKVLEQIKAFMDARETCFLFATFDEFIADIDELSDEERAAYSARNAELVNALIDSYQVLYDGLEELRGKCRNPIRPIALDLSDLSSIDAYQALLEQEQPEIRMLVNAAGCGVFGPFAEADRKKLISSAQLNSLALTGMCHASLPYMHSGSNIINMGSNSAWQPVPFQAVYGASKSYVLSLSRALGRELRPQGIHVMCVCPGWIKTEFQQVAHHDEFIRYVDKWYGPDEVAAQAMKDLKKKKSVSILGHPVRRQVRLVKLLPVDTVMDIWCKQQGIE